MKITAKDLPHHDQPSDNDGLSHEPFIEFPYTRAIAGYGQSQQKPEEY